MTNESVAFVSRRCAAPRRCSASTFARSPRRVPGLILAAAGSLLAWSGAAPAQTIDQNLWGTDGTVFSMARAGNKLYVGGWFNAVKPAADQTGATRNRVAALDLTTGGGTAWNPDAGFDGVRAIAVDGNTVYLGGDFTTIGGQARNHIAAVDATTGAVTAWNPGANGRVEDLLVMGSTVYAGGTFTIIGGQVRSYLAALDATTGTVASWNAQANGTVEALEPVGSIVYVGGGFTSFRGQTRFKLAAFDAATGEITGWNPHPNGPVFALAAKGSTIYAGGNFQLIGGQPRDNLAALDATTAAVSAWAPNPNGMVRALALADITIYAGGDFTQVGGQLRSRIAALEVSTGHAVPWWNPNASDTGNGQSSVYALTLDGSWLYVGGSFWEMSGLPRPFLVGIEAVPQPIVAVPPGADPGAARLALALHPNPAQRSLRVAFTLPDAAAARLELFEVSGRRVVARDVGEFGPGAHVLPLGNGMTLAPGVYLLRLTQGARAITARAIVLK